MMIDWKSDDSEIAKFGRFSQMWDIAKELKSGGEKVTFVSPEMENECTMVWKSKFYQSQIDFIDLLNDYTEWAKEHYNR